MKFKIGDKVIFTSNIPEQLLRNTPCIVVEHSEFSGIIGVQIDHPLNPNLFLYSHFSNFRLYQEFSLKDKKDNASLWDLMAE